MLRNLENGQRELECYGSVVGQINFDISWTQILWVISNPITVAELFYIAN